MTITANISEVVSPVAVEVICAHCGLDVPAGLFEAEESEQFCCAGCRAVYRTLHACGLDAFYRLRDVAGRPVTPAESGFGSFDSPTFHKLYVQTRENIASADLVLEGVACAACVWLVERLPHVLPGVVESRLSLRQGIVRVSWDIRRTKLSEVGVALNRLGYTPHPAKGTSRKTIHRLDERKRMVGLAVSGALMGNTMLLAFALYAARGGRMDEVYHQFFRWISAIFGVICLAVPGAVFFRSAWAAIRVKRINLDVPIALALLAGGIAGTVNVILNRGEIYFDTLTVLVFLLLVGRFVQFRQKRYADDAVELLFSLAPATCRIVGADGTVEEMPIEALAVGNLIEIRSGEAVAADGVVEAGNSNVIQALLTGESLPVAVGVGSEVFGGSQNQGAMLRVRVKSVGEETRAGRLMRVVERGISEKPAIVQFADRAGGWFVAAVSLAAMGTFICWSRFGVGVAIDHSIALLIVTCPCALGLVTPLTLAMTIGRLARQDILVKSGSAIEKLAERGEMLLDKTGTLTVGRLQMVYWKGPDDLGPVVAGLERHSQHPVARALVESLESPDEKFEFREIQDRGDGGLCGLIDIAGSGYWGRIHVGSPGYMGRAGVSVGVVIRGCQKELEESGITVVLVALGGEAVAIAGLADRVREDSKGAIGALKKLGWRQRILSGDAQAVVNRVAEEVGVDLEDAVGEVTPEGKLGEIVDGRMGERSQRSLNDQRIRRSIKGEVKSGIKCNAGEARQPIRPQGFSRLPRTPSTLSLPLTVLPQEKKNTQNSFGFPRIFPGVGVEGKRKGGGEGAGGAGEKLLSSTLRLRPEGGPYLVFPGSTAFGSEAQARRELTEVRPSCIASNSPAFDLELNRSRSHAGIEDVFDARGGVNSEDKNKRGPIVMVGDGVNDAAALAAADVGIAVHGGAEASLAAADVYVAAPGMMPVVTLVKSCRKTMGIIRRNLLMSLGYNALAGGLAMAGKMNPLVAAILMPISSAALLTIAITSVRRISGGRQ